MENDRGEMCNLAVEKQYQGIVKEHRALLLEWMRKIYYAVARVAYAACSGAVKLCIDTK